MFVLTIGNNIGRANTSLDDSVESKYRNEWSLASTDQGTMKSRDEEEELFVLPRAQDSQRALALAHAILSLLQPHTQLHHCDSNEDIDVRFRGGRYSIQPPRAFSIQQQALVHVCSCDVCTSHSWNQSMNGQHKELVNSVCKC